MDLDHVKLEIDTDVSAVRDLQEQLKNDPQAVEDLRRDPVQFLQRVGVKIDRQMYEEAKKQAEKSPTGPTPAGFVHVDL